MPWYTPTRVMWVQSAANFGHRSGGDSGKYPEWYEDATPPLFNIGLGSPVGVTFGYTDRPVASYGPDAVVDRFDDLFAAVEGLRVA